MCPIMNVYRNMATKISRPNAVTFLFVGLDEELILKKKGGYVRLIAH
jgi:hypothetical protein